MKLATAKESRQNTATEYWNGTLYFKQYWNGAMLKQCNTERVQYCNRKRSSHDEASNCRRVLAGYNTQYIETEYCFICAIAKEYNTATEQGPDDETCNCKRVSASSSSRSRNCNSTKCQVQKLEPTRSREWDVRSPGQDPDCCSRY